MNSITSIFWVKSQFIGASIIFPHPVYKTLFIKIEFFLEGVVPKKSTLKFRADILSLGVFNYADYESDG